ncbi:MAG: DegT/DnrJ/EryC1/StrS family aminotransferase [Clostridia bacterium]|nr:DegT/DnrJ/EryC1/StrS family aminotransferase [Clostridia bacterium]
MTTPILDFVRAYTQADKVRFHMPGHKGKPVLGPEPLDITEIPGADVLYRANGIIRESERNASGLFGSGITVYSCEGATLAVKAMLALAQKKTTADRHKKNTHILAFRNVHSSFVYGAALLDLNVSWIYPDTVTDSLVSCPVSPESVEKAILELQDKPDALFVTSPDYLGCMQDLRPLKALCRKYGMMLLVDNAHGAYLKFDGSSLHPMDAFADMCADSAHKTLGVLTGGAYLHLSREISEQFTEDGINGVFAMFASTSPSYLILQSLDAANLSLAGSYPEQLKACEKAVQKAKNELTDSGFSILPGEALKITIRTLEYGYRGDELASLLSRDGIECEYSDESFVVFMVSPFNEETDLVKLVRTLKDLEKKPALPVHRHEIQNRRTALRIREALFANTECLEVDSCEGRIFSGAVMACPPAVPILICGEIISKEDIAIMKSYGISTCCVVR